MITVEIPSKKEIEKAKREKKSLAELLSHLDIYSKFKIVCKAQQITIRTGLREAVQDYLNKHEFKK